MLPCRYFPLTFTLPSELRPLARAHQKKVYGLLMSSAAAAVQKLALGPALSRGALDPGTIRALLPTISNDCASRARVLPTVGDIQGWLIDRQSV